MRDERVEGERVGDERVEGERHKGLTKIMFAKD